MNMNRFSLHGVYRNRLIRAYLGASRARRRAHWFTGFDEDDDIPISHLQPGFLQVEHLLDPPRLISELARPRRKPSRNLSLYLRDQFGKEAPALLEMIEQHPDLENPSKALCHELVKELNKLLSGPPWLDGRVPRESATGDQESSSARVSKAEGGRRSRSFSKLAFWQRGRAARARPESETALFDMNDPQIQRLGSRGLDSLLLNRLLLSWAYEHLIASPAQTKPRPLHVVNTALNLVSGSDLAWQERKADSFTISPLHSGNRRLGYRPSEDYGHGLSLGSAMAISGAAASPNMGYHSSSAATFLLALFNVRLGSWLGNPGIHGQSTYKLWSPRSSLSPIVSEALGLTRDHNPYVYLSDGGHFENLGLYEMVLRRCGVIVLCDAAADPQCRLDDLGNAIRKIRIDLGVPIEFNEFSIKRRDLEPPGKYCAIGRILYPVVDGPKAAPGILIYLKPSLCGTEPRDVFNYKETSKHFPHEPTSDQFFSESQFESYRTLGLHIVEEICRHIPEANDSSGGPLEAFATATRNYLAAAAEKNG
jgi:hypothetical protein